MKIEKPDILLIGVCAVAGFVFLLFPTNGNLVAAVGCGVPTGALGGCVACVLRRLLRQTVPEGFYIWDAGDKVPTNAPGGK